MGRDPEQKALEPFPTAESPAAGAKIEITPQRYVLPKNLLDRLLRDREADAQQTIAAGRGKPFEG